MDVFKSRIDKGILICFILSIIACPLGASVMLMEGGTLNYSLATIILIVGTGFPLWILLSTKYIVENDNLKIMSGPFSWNILIKSIKSVQETQNAITSPALSFDRLEITYEDDKVILISPANKKQFMQKLDKDKLSGISKNTPQQAIGKPPKNSTKRNKRIRRSA